ncbi:MAG: gliding motility protein GldN [Sphingobacteriaceae bacterium]
MKNSLLSLGLALLSLSVWAQAPNLNNSTKPKPVERPQDGYFKKSNVINAKVIPYAPVREADIIFSKRIWREIDLRDPLNKPLIAPKSRLVDVILDAVMAGELTAYDPTPTKEDIGGDEFSKVLTAKEAYAQFVDSVLVPKFDADGNQISAEMKAGEFNPDSILKFRIKEDWIFDKQRSVFEPRIIGIAPMVRKQAAGESFEDQPAFWIYFPEVRHILVTRPVVNSRNDATSLTFDDVFMKRIFASYIVKESNDQDLRIKDYAQGIDRLYESERIKKALLDWEHDLWSY